MNSSAVAEQLRKLAQYAMEARAEVAGPEGLNAWLNFRAIVTEFEPGLLYSLDSDESPQLRDLALAAVEDLVAAAGDPGHLDTGARPDEVLAEMRERARKEVEGIADSEPSALDDSALEVLAMRSRQSA